MFPFSVSESCFAAATELWLKLKAERGKKRKLDMQQVGRLPFTIPRQKYNEMEDELTL